MREEEFLSEIRLNRKIIFKLVHLYTNNHQDKEDLYQEILLQAWKAWPTFRGESKFSTWLYRLSLNTIFSVQRKKLLPTTDEPFPKEGRAEESGNEDVEQLYQALKLLTETDRALISLHLEGYNNQEIAEIIGVSANNAGVKLHRAKQQLKIILESL